MVHTVLVVDDEPMMREAVASYLESQGCRVFSAENGKEALAIFDREAITFVILDLMLPDISGEEVCKALRKVSRVPVIMLTSKTQEEAVLNGLQIGADDYVTKPFRLKELYARILAVSRRSFDDLKPLSEKYSWNDHDLDIDFDRREIQKKGSLLSLTPSEWNILSALIQHPQKVYTREELIALIFGPDFDGYDRVNDTHVRNLRKKIEDDPKRPVYIKTVHGLGYKFGGDDR